MGVNTKGQRIGVYIENELLSRCDAAIPRTNASSRSEFIRDAVEHYLAVLSAKENSRVLTPALESVIGGKIAGTEERINRILWSSTKSGADAPIQWRSKLCKEDKSRQKADFQDRQEETSTRPASPGGIPRADYGLIVPKAIPNLC